MLCCGSCTSSPPIGPTHLYPHPFNTPKQVANNKGERQRLYGLRFPADSRPGLLVGGARLIDKNGARAGAVTSVLPTEGRALAYVRKTVPQPVVGAELFVEGAEGTRGPAVTVVELPYATREEAQSASGRRAVKAGAGVAVAAKDGADAAAAKAAEEARKAQKLEEMRKRVEAFQARQKQQQQQQQQQQGP